MVGLLKFAFFGGGGFCIVRVMVYRGGGRKSMFVLGLECIIMYEYETFGRRRVGESEGRRKRGGKKERDRNEMGFMINERTGIE
jgi:hypothetical protein